MIDKESLHKLNAINCIKVSLNVSGDVINGKSFFLHLRLTTHDRVTHLHRRPHLSS